MDQRRERAQAVLSAAWPPQGQQPYRGAIRLRDRLCYKPLAMIDYGIVWTTTTEETAKLTGLLTEINQAWSGPPQR